MAVTVGPSHIPGERAPKGQGTRSTILAAAVELGSVRGLEELSMGELASTVQMSKSGLFAHFGSKEELQLATVGRAWEVFQAEVLESPAEGAESSFRALLERWLSFYERRVFTGGCLFLVSAVEFSGKRGAVREALASAVAAQVAALESGLSRARDSGELRLEIDDVQTAIELHSVLIGADALFRVHDDPVVFQRARVTIGGLLGKPAGFF